MSKTEKFYFGGIKKIKHKGDYEVFGPCGGVIESCGPVAGSCVEDTSPPGECRSGIRYYCTQTWSGGEYYGSLTTAGTC